MNLHLPAAAAILACAGLCGLAADRAETDAGRPRGTATSLGGFSALAVQGLWMRATRAKEQRREDEALLYLRAINDLAPQVVSAARYVAFEIGANLAAGRTDPEVKWTLTAEGLRALDGAVRENPENPDAWANRAMFVMIRLTRDPVMAARYRREVLPAGPEHAARRDFAQAVRLSPLDIEYRLGHAIAADREGQVCLERGEIAVAADAFGDSVAAYDGLISTLEADEFPAESRMGGELARIREYRAEVADRAARARGQ